LHEAFVEYPPEEEWHHGDIDYVVSEDSTEYGCYQIDTVDNEKIEEYKTSFYND